MSDIKVTLKRPSLTAEFEVGSLKELVGFLQQEETELHKLFGDDLAMVLERIGNGGTAISTGTVATGETEQGDAAPKARKKRGAPDPVNAAAPAPIDPPAAIAAPVAEDGIPDSLRRAPAPATAAAPPPPPALPSAPPIAPAAPTPPNSVLAQNFIAELQRRAAGSADGGGQLVAWLQSGLVKPNAPGVAAVTFEEALAVVRTASDAQIKPFADALGVTV